MNNEQIKKTDEKKDKDQTNKKTYYSNRALSFIRTE